MNIMKNKILSGLLIVSAIALSSCGSGSSKHASFNKTDQFEINEDSVNELKAKLDECSKETAIAMDNFSATLVGKDINVDQKEETKEKDYSTEEIKTSSTSIKFSNLNFNVNLGSKGIYTAKEAKEFMAYAELSEITGSLRVTSKQNDEKEKSGSYKLDSNTAEFYHYDAKEYIHMSAGFKSTVFGIAKKMADEDNALSITAAEAMIPKNGKFCISGLFSENTKYPLSEMPDENYHSNTFDFIDVEGLLKLQNAALENGYELEDLISFKVTSDKSHYLALQMEIDKQGLENIKDLTAKTGEDMVELPLDINTSASEINNYKMTVEYDAKKRLSYATIILDGLNVSDEEDLDEYSTYASSTWIKDSNINLELTMDYKANPAKKIPNVKELEAYTEYDLATFLNGFTL